MLELTQEQIMQNWTVKDTENPLVSVRCITYNHEPYIAQAIDGFLMQKTDFPFEVIIHDDASTDKTADIIREYEKKYPLIIKPIYQTENQYSKRNGSIAKAIDPKLKGKYIAFCEGDDYWIDPNKLQMQVDFLEKNPEYGMCYTNFNIFNQQKQKFRYNLFDTESKQFLPIYSSVEQWVLRKGYIAPMTWVFRSDLYKRFESVKSCDGTFELVTFFLAKSKIAYMAGNATAVYRLLEKSASHSKDFRKLERRAVNLYETQIKLIDMYCLSADLKKECSESFYRDNFTLFARLRDRERLKISLKLRKYNFICLLIYLFTASKIGWRLFVWLYSVSLDTKT